LQAAEEAAAEEPEEEEEEKKEDDIYRGHIKSKKNIEELDLSEEYD